MDPDIARAKDESATSARRRSVYRRFLDQVGIGIRDYTSHPCIAYVGGEAAAGKAVGSGLWMGVRYAKVALGA